MYCIGDPKLMFNLLRVIFTACLLAYSSLSTAITVEAQGQSMIFDGDLDSARRNAIRNASQQAALQASVFVSSTQKVTDGVLSIDNMQIKTLGQVNDIEIIDEVIRNQTLHVRIRANVEYEADCKNGPRSQGYMKSLAITAFPLLTPTQAILGSLENIQSGFSTQLTNNINENTSLTARNAGLLTMHPELMTAPSRQLSAGAISTVLQEIQQLDVQYVVSGVIRDMTMHDPDTIALKRNILVDFYNRQDYRSKRHLRNLVVDVFIHDGFSGALLFNKQYVMAGRWNLAPEAKIGFASAAYWKQDYGIQTRLLISQITDDIQAELRCKPFAASITQTDGNFIWFNAGSQAGINVGDRLSVYRKSSFYTNGISENVQLTNTQSSITVTDVQPFFSVGRLTQEGSTYNIQPDDVVITH